MYLYLAFVCSLLLPLTFSCSCPFNPSITRYDAICDAFSSSWVKSVYKARVLSAFCNCIVTSSSNQFSCIQFYTGPQGHVIGNVEETYQCDISRLYYYDECPSIAMKAGTVISSVAGRNSTTVENVTCDDLQYIDPQQGGGCSITHQPCYYTIAIDTVYKGNVNQSFNTSGPDVLTSCGQYGRVLTVGESYIVGVGGVCVPIRPWSSFDSYSSSEIQLLENLKDGTSCSMTTSASSRVESTGGPSVQITSASSRVQPTGGPSVQITSASSSTGVEPTGGLSVQQVIIIGVTVPTFVILIVVIAVVVSAAFYVLMVARKKTMKWESVRKLSQTSEDRNYELSPSIAPEDGDKAELVIYT